MGEPVFAVRWTVTGRTPDGGNCTTIFDLALDRGHLIVYPAAVGDFALSLDLDAVRMLLSIVEARSAGMVPGLHPLCGYWLLGVAPYSSSVEPEWTDRAADAPPYLGPIELYVRLPDKEIHIIYRTDRYQALLDTLTEAVACLEGRKHHAK
ncbi:hypothetical protein [Actinokineospora sp.]|uniref:hypothetical protein n=1 Tax=Actinokineospora sp. TaxID=1872133 RepID=UPI0040381C35